LIKNAESIVCISFPYAIYALYVVATDGLSPNQLICRISYL
jgi:hypothetical protein